ncbi:MAG TPA: hypothetical protein VMJ32_04145 [Pirellulales bacterium]|nr:hypothetical protein [Pirellulales bacterium]
MSLEQWSQNGWLRRDETTLAEIQQLFQVVDRDFADAQLAGLSVDGQFQHAYDAALQLCIIPLRVCGYRVTKGQGHHKYSIDSLQFTLGSNWSKLADHIERCSRLRGQAVYECIGAVQKEDAEDLIELVRQLRKDVVDWIRKQHTKLLPPGI